MSDKARRYNKGKTRFVLIPPFAKQCIADVYTRGAHKYTLYKDKDGKQFKGSEIPIEDVGNYEVIDDARDNWRKGLSWIDTLDSHDRHIEAFKNSEDLDPELKTYHLANAAWNLITLLEYYKIYPQGDDRPHKYLKHPKIGLDIDEVICDWVGAWTKLHNLEVPTSWFFDREIMSRFEEMRKNGTLDDFYLSLQPRMSPLDIPFEPHVYVTSRPVDTKITEKWLDIHGFPARPVITVPTGTSKVEAIKKAGVEIFVDDRWENFVELNNAGICTYLFDSPHNQRYFVGFKRIHSLKELV